MKTLRIGCGSGGCTYERLEPAVELLEKGRLDYLIFECLAERTIAAAQKEKQADPTKGYNPMLEARMRRVLPLAAKHGTTIVSNMGAANTPRAVELTAAIAADLGLSGLKIASVRGDDILERVRDYRGLSLLDRQIPLGNLEDAIISANVYLSGNPIREALETGAKVVITGRVADPALFVGPLKHEFAWNADDESQMGQAILLGHLLECAGQLTGGYYADPGYKDVADLHLLGFPIAEIDATGTFVVTKPEGSGGTVCVDVCKEQLLYEIDDPARYITPDGIADFSRVTFAPTGEDHVTARGAVCRGEPTHYKVNIGYRDCWTGEAQISYGGGNALDRARLAADIVEKRLRLIDVTPDEYRVDSIGCTSLYGTGISKGITSCLPSEVRLRIAARTKTREEAIAVVREVECLYTNGPSGGAGIRSSVEQPVCVDNILIPRADVSPEVAFIEVT